MTHGRNPENTEAIFLDGIRFDNNILGFGLRIEPIRDFIFDFIYEYDREKNITDEEITEQNYGFVKFSLRY